MGRGVTGRGEVGAEQLIDSIGGEIDRGGRGQG